MQNTIKSQIRAALIGLALSSTTLVAAAPALAQEAGQSVDEQAVASQFVEQLVSKLRRLAEAGDADEERLEGLSAVLTQDMAVSRLQRFLLSREQRESLSAEEVAEYDAIFPRYIASAFAGSIDQLVSRQIDVRQVIERRPGDFIVRSKLLTDKGEERASLDWRVLDKRGEKQLVDVIVDGLSFNVERRAQFTAILNKDGFGALMAHMKEVAGEES